MDDIRIAALFRSYSKTEEGVEEVVGRAIQTANHMLDLEGVDVFFMVPLDKDCGRTIDVLREELYQSGLDYVFALGFHGDLNGEALSHGLLVLSGLGFTHCLVASNKAVSYLDDEVMERVVGEIKGGSKVIGISISELDDAQEIPVTNTACVWELEALRRVGWFDSTIGVEEITPLVQLSRQSDTPCISLISGSDSGGLNIREAGDGWAHHAKVKSTKRERQEAEAERVGASLDWLREQIKIVL